MKKQTETLLSEAIDLVDAADHVLANTMTQYDLSAKDCYSLAEKLERATNGISHQFFMYPVPTALQFLPKK